jgi:uncharacterized protein YdeI (YjbR/CyaY-like superfamily)
LDEELYVASREQWRAWLEKHHSTKSEIWLLFYKQHTGKPCVSYNDALDEALCFGWIDSIVKRVDDERYLRKFTPRKSSSVWSEVNKRRVERLICVERMAKAGLARVREAKKSGEWFKRRVREKELEVPAFFEEALATNKKALENFKGLAPSYRRNMVGWVLSAKKEETRRKRLAEVIGVLERGEKLGLK